MPVGTTDQMSPARAAVPHVALGIQGQVEDFADAVGARHLMNERFWMRHFEAAIENPDARYSVILDGAEISGAIERSAARANRDFFAVIADRQPSPFDWEMYRLQTSGAASRATFYLGGRVVPNPFS
ncbi:hypothetical protein [Nocardia lasii]|uniref:Uncharacterized protein n=1 Tax=Nocardia lasii TaxID=1616107 RepID=A0ABW1JKJ3_9NOCA